MSENQFIRINRELLYNEIWEISASGVAKKYNVPYAELLRLCKEVEVPIPPSGYWVKLSFGKPVDKIPLPASSLSEIMLPMSIKPKHSKCLDDSKSIGLKTFEGVKVPIVPQNTLAFLTKDERKKELLAAEQIQMPDENAKLHKKIKAYQSKVKEWNKNDRKPEGAQRGFKNYSNRPPFLAGVISNETLSRVYRILDALYCQVEALGGSVNDDLSLTIRNECVNFEIFEAQDEIKHELTRQEAQALIVYEDAKRHG